MLKYFTTAILAALVITAACLNACKNSSGPSVLSKEDSLKQQLDRGNYLVNSVVHCLYCHSQLDFKKFSLPVIPGTEGSGGIAIHELDSTFPGKIVIPNITPHGLKDWTDKEIARAIAKGISKNGDTLMPAMPFHEFSKMTKEDVDAVIAYIRTLKPIETNYPKRQLFVPVSVFGPLPDNDYTTNTKPDTSDKIKYGNYLVNIAGCQGCHTPMEGKPNAGKLFAGGNEDKFPTFTVRTPNITPDTATGIGGWTEDMFIAKFRNNSSPENLSRDAGKQNTIMAWSFFGTMRDNDLKAIYAYLRSLPPVHNTVVKWPE
jgi:mono/diheme cytochrome c family protein